MAILKLTSLFKILKFIQKQVFGGDLEEFTKVRRRYFTKLGINTIGYYDTQNPEYAEIEYPRPHRKYSGYNGY